MTGEIGTGKTLLCRTVLQRLDRKTFVSVIDNPLLDPVDLLRQMLQDFGVLASDRTTMPALSRHDLVHALEDFLSSLIALDAHAVVIIDEAQHLHPDVLEQIRLLSNIDTPGGTMLQILLIGQLGLDSVLALPELRQVQQRVSRRIRLEPLGEDEVRLYIAHRLTVGRTAGSRMPGAGDLAGALAEWDGALSGATFTAGAVQAIWRMAGGLPRLVNLLCDHALEAACAQGVRTIDADLAGTAAIALQLRVEPDATAPLVSVEIAVPATAAAWQPVEVIAPRPRRRIAGTIAALAVVAVAAWFVNRAAPWAAGWSRPSPAAVPAATSRPTVVPSTPGPAVAPAPESAPTTAPATAAPELASPTPVAAPVADGTAFEILVASFRTEARAASVAAQVSDAALPVRRRVASGWQQVIAGPFTSRDEADAARQRLERAGLPGTQIVSAGR